MMHSTLAVLLLIGFASIISAAPSKAVDNPLYQNLSARTEAFLKQIRNIDVAFEKNAALGNRSALAQILNSTKIANEQTVDLLVDWKEFIEMLWLSPRQEFFMLRLKSEETLLQVKMLSAILRVISQEILGFESGLTTLPSYHYDQVTELALMKFRESSNVYSASIEKAQRLLDEAAQKNATLQTITKFLQRNIVNALNEAINGISTAKTTLSGVLSEQLQAVRLSEQQLSLKQRLSAEFALDNAHFLIDYLSQFKQYISAIPSE